MNTNFNGLIAATFTPIGLDGAIQTQQIAPVVENLVVQKVEGIFVCGSTGEGLSLTTAERKEVTEAFLEASAGRLKVFVHVGHNSVKEMAELATHANEKGADAISAAVPHYYGINSEEHLARVLAEGVGHVTDIPFFYYHIPSKTGLNLDMVKFLQAGKERIPSLAGIKYTAPTLYEFQSCMEMFKEYQMCFGVDEMFLSGLTLGSRAMVGSTYNFMAPVYHQIREAFDRGDMKDAAKLQFEAVEVINLILKYQPLAAQKTIMKWIGLDSGRTRQPIESLTEQEERQLANELKKTKFYSWQRESIDSL